MPTFAISVREKDCRSSDGKYPVSIRITHQRVSLLIPTDLYVHRKQIKSDFSGLRDGTLIVELSREIQRYEEILFKGLGVDLSPYTAKELKTYILRQRKTCGGQGIDFIAFGFEFVKQLKKKGRQGYAMPFEAVLNHLIDFFGRPAIYIREINVRNLLEFADYLQEERRIERPNQFGGTTRRIVKAVRPQTVQDYFTRIQIIFNAAKEKYNDPDNENDLITHYPFSSKKLRIEIKDAPAKRDLSVEDLIKILNAESLPGRRMQLARDVCALSFYLVAMNTVDLYGADVKRDGQRITYRRQKTTKRRKDEAFFSVQVVPEVVPLLKKYRDPSRKRLFIFYKLYSDYKGFNKNVNKGCEQLASYLGVNPKLTSYYMRHTLATIAAEDCGIGEEDVALMLNHVGDGQSLGSSKNLKVTRGYIHRRFDRNDVNHRKVLDYLHSKGLAPDR